MKHFLEHLVPHQIVDIWVFTQKQKTRCINKPLVSYVRALKQYTENLDNTQGGKEAKHRWQDRASEAVQFVALQINPD